MGLWIYCEVRALRISQGLHKVSRGREMSRVTTRFFGLENLEEGFVLTGMGQTVGKAGECYSHWTPRWKG